MAAPYPDHHHALGCLRREFPLSDEPCTCGRGAVSNNPWPLPKPATPTFSADPAEDTAFQAWVEATRPSGNTEEVHRGWLRSDARHEFLVGKHTAVEAAAARIFHKAFSQAPATEHQGLPRYEYKLVEAPGVATPNELSALLNREGAEGWALCAIVYSCFILMRPKS